MTPAIKKVLDNTCREGIKIAKDFSGQRYFSLMQLAMMDHPYAVRHSSLGFPRGMGVRITQRRLLSLDPAVINNQSGDFLKHWRYVVITGRAGPTGRIINDSAHAGALDTGTWKMIRRPIRQRIVSIVRPSFIVDMNDAIRKALQ